MCLADKNIYNTRTFSVLFEDVYERKIYQQ
jgi:hypothetical protein